MSDDSGTFKRIATALEGILAILETSLPVVNNSTVIQRDGTSFQYPSHTIQLCACGDEDCTVDL